MNSYYLLILLSLLLSLPSQAAGLGKLRIPRRDPSAGTNLIDLSRYYNAALDEAWHPSGREGNDLSELPHGLQKLGGVEFDLRGVVQLSGSGARNSRGRYPGVVHIKVGLRCRALDFLHGTAFGEEDGTQIGTYVIHYTDGKREEVPIVYGQEVRDWWAYPQESNPTPRASVGWKGQNGATRAWGGISLQLFQVSWKNPRPDAVVKSIDFVALPVDALPFLVAITAETGAGQSSGTTPRLGARDAGRQR